MTTSVEHLGTILGVWAHPDDEAYLSAGLMAIARHHGQRVVVITATAGELGAPDPVEWPAARLGPYRRHELAASLAALGVAEHHWLDWPDGGCDAVPDEIGAARIGRLIDDVRPDTIVTFGPEGMTGHPDHQAVSRWTSMAWRARRRRARLLFATTTPEFQAEWADVHDELGLWLGVDGPPVTPEVDLGLRVDCPDRVLDQKLVALRAQASQTGPLMSILGEEAYRRWWRSECFVDAARVLTTSTDRGTRPVAATERGR